MKNNKKKILKELGKIFEKNNLKEKDKVSDLEQFDSIIILQVMNLAKISYKKNVDGAKIAKCKTISDIINLLE